MPKVDYRTLVDIYVDTCFYLQVLTMLANAGNLNLLLHSYFLSILIFSTFDIYVVSNKRFKNFFDCNVYTSICIINYIFISTSMLSLTFLIFTPPPVHSFSR